MPTPKANNSSSIRTNTKKPGNSRTKAPSGSAAPVKTPNPNPGYKPPIGNK